MLISVDKVRSILNQFSISISGVLHIGAHDCEELGVYHTLGLQSSDVIWIDAIQEKVDANIQRGIPNVYNAVVSNKDDDEVVFHRTNNDQSSSILPLETHAHHYPSITVQSQTVMKTITVDTFLKTHAIDPTKLQFWNFDIQGAELLALKGAESAIQYAKVLYLEVNKEPLYKGCALVDEIDTYLNSKGFIRVLTQFVDQGWGDALYVRI